MRDSHPVPPSASIAEDTGTRDAETPPSKSAVGGTTACPICGSDEPHGHGAEARFDVESRPAAWAVLSPSGDLVEPASRSRDTAEMWQRFYAKHYPDHGAYTVAPLYLPSARAYAEPTKAQHPESTCERCGGKNGVWFAPNDLWNRVVPSDGILCPTCFILAAEAVGVKPTAWVVAPDAPAVDAGTTEAVRHSASEVRDALRGIRSDNDWAHWVLSEHIAYLTARSPAVDDETVKLLEECARRYECDARCSAEFYGEPGDAAGERAKARRLTALARSLRRAPDSVPEANNG